MDRGQVRIGLFTACAVGALALAVCAAEHAGAAIIHSGSDNPTNDGWSEFQSGSASGAASPDNQAWRVSGSSDGFLFYTQAPTPAEVAAGNTAGWVLTTEIRLPTTDDAVDFGTISEYIDGVDRWTMQFGTNSSGDPIVALVGGSNPSFTLTGAGNGGYHTFELRYDPGSGTADLFVDGTEQISNHDGAPVAVTRVFFGDGDTLESGTGDYRLVQWEVVPEPSTFGVLATAGALPMSLRRRRQRRHVRVYRPIPR